MDTELTPVRGPAIRALAQKINAAADPQIMAIVATVDAMMSRGQADQLVAPLRQRLKSLRPPRPLRFARLMFHPLQTLIVPPARWQRGQHTIPRTVLTPIAEHVRQNMDAQVTAIQSGLAGRTTADIDQILMLGGTVWPVAAVILAQPVIPEKWETTGLSASVYRPLADLIATLLSQAMPLEVLCSDTANGLLPPDNNSVAAMVESVSRANPNAAPAMLALLLARQPKAIPQLKRLRLPPPTVDVPAALDQAAELLLRQLDENEGLEARIAAGSLADASGVVSGINTLLVNIDTPGIKPRRREQIRELRQRLDNGCRARFASGLQDEVLAPLQHPGVAPTPEEITALEAGARGLRMLETEARTIGGAKLYDELLGQAVAVIKEKAMRDRLSLPDQVRLVEILAGPDAAMALLKSKPAYALS